MKDLFRWLDMNGRWRRLLSPAPPPPSTAASRPLTSPPAVASTAPPSPPPAAGAARRRWWSPSCSGRPVRAPVGEYPEEGGSAGPGRPGRAISMPPCLPSPCPLRRLSSLALEKQGRKGARGRRPMPRIGRNGAEEPGRAIFLSFPLQPHEAVQWTSGGSTMPALCRYVEEAGEGHQDEERRSSNTEEDRHEGMSSILSPVRPRPRRHRGGRTRARPLPARPRLPAARQSSVESRSPLFLLPDLLHLIFCVNCLLSRGFEEDDHGGSGSVIFTDKNWFWIGAAGLLGFTILFNMLFTLSLTYLNPLGKPQAVISEETAKEAEGNGLPKETVRNGSTKSKDGSSNKEIKEMRLSARLSNSSSNGISRVMSVGSNGAAPRRGMVLPFSPLSMCFDDVNYYVDMPAEMKHEGVTDDRLQLLREVTRSFRPGVLTALMGVSGAGKTTLMDVLDGRKTGGYIEGDIRISGYPKNQATFARISGYCEQNDIHSPQVTIRESLIYSAFLRLPENSGDQEITDDIKIQFVDEVMELVELDNLKDALVGLPGITGLSTEQRKRLTIAVELVANPSIIFMDEPTSGLDTRAAAIVMRTVRNTVDTGRTVVCTIHQPSIDIFEAFDELLSLKRGGQVIYSGKLGRNSQKMIEYFEAIPGVPKIKDKYNPATWMLEVSSVAAEVRLSMDFADYYKTSDLYKQNKVLVNQLSQPEPGTSDLHFATEYSQSIIGQFKACLWKHWLTYWRSPDYNLVRFSFTLFTALLLGSIFWKIGTNMGDANTLRMVIGAMYTAVMFVGIKNCATVQPIVSIERTVFYRERAAGMYSAMPYTIAQVVIEIPYVFVQASYYTLIVYAMMSFQWTAVKFFWFFFVSYFSFLYFTYYGMMTVSISPNHEVAGIFTAAFYSLFNLFSGFFIPRPKIPKWWVWYYWICPLAWTVYGLIVTQYGDLEEIISVLGQSNQTISYYVTHHFGYHRSFMPVVAPVLVLFAVFFAFMYALCIKKLNFQQR